MCMWFPSLCVQDQSCSGTQETPIASSMADLNMTMEQLSFRTPACTPLKLCCTRHVPDTARPTTCTSTVAASQGHMTWAHWVATLTPVGSIFCRPASVWPCDSWREELAMLYFSTMLSETVSSMSIPSNYLFQLHSLTSSCYWSPSGSWRCTSKREYFLLTTVNFIDLNYCSLPERHTHSMLSYLIDHQVAPNVQLFSESDFGSGLVIASNSHTRF